LLTFYYICNLLLLLFQLPDTRDTQTSVSRKLYNILKVYSILQVLWSAKNVHSRKADSGDN